MEKYQEGDLIVAHDGDEVRYGRLYKPAKPGVIPLVVMGLRTRLHPTTDGWEVSCLYDPEHGRTVYRQLNTPRSAELHRVAKEALLTIKHAITHAKPRRRDLYRDQIGTFMLRDGTEVVQFATPPHAKHSFAFAGPEDERVTLLWRPSAGGCWDMRVVAEDGATTHKKLIRGPRDADQRVLVELAYKKLRRRAKKAQKALSAAQTKPAVNAQTSTPTAWGSTVPVPGAKHVQAPATAPVIDPWGQPSATAVTAAPPASFAASDEIEKATEKATERLAQQMHQVTFGKLAIELCRVYARQRVDEVVAEAQKRAVIEALQSVVAG